jgi:hypothetical protein
MIDLNFHNYHNYHDNLRSKCVTADFERSAPFESPCELSK